MKLTSIFSLSKKVFFTMALCVSATITASAQGVKEYDFNWDKLDESSVWKASHVRLGYTLSTLETSVKPVNLEQDSDWGAFYSKGKTYFLHDPIGRMLRFGINATWCDLNYQQYSIGKGHDKQTSHQAEFALGVGPSVTFMPVGKLALQGYFEYRPTFAALYDDFDDEVENVYINYASVWAYGATLSWSRIGVGVEYRWGDVDYKCIHTSLDVDKDMLNMDCKMSALRAFITYNF